MFSDKVLTAYDSGLISNVSTIPYKSIVDGHGYYQ